MKSFNSISGLIIVLLVNIFVSIDILISVIGRNLNWEIEDDITFVG